MPDKIFISYSRVDTTFVLKLANDLRNAGANIWLDQLDIPPGAHWDNAIEAALNSATCVLAIISPRSMESKNAMDEISYALEQNKKVIPVLLTNTETSFRLRRLQRIDFTGDYDMSVKQLIKAINISDVIMEEKPAERNTGIPEKENPVTRLPAVPAEERQGSRPGTPADPKPAGETMVVPRELLEHIQENIAYARFPAQNASQVKTLPKSSNVKMYAAIFTGIFATAAITWGLVRYSGQPKEISVQSNIPTILTNRITDTDSLEQVAKPVAAEEIKPRVKKETEENKIVAEAEPAEVKPVEVKPPEIKPAGTPKTESLTNIPSTNEKAEEHIKPQEAESPIKTPIITEAPKQQATSSPVTNQSEAASTPVTSTPRMIKIRKDITLSVTFSNMPDLNNKRKMQPVTLVVTDPVVYDGKVIIEKGATAEGEISIGTVASTLVIKKIKTAGNPVIPSPFPRDGIAVRNINLTRANPVIIEKGTKISL